MPSSGYAAWSVVADEQPTAAKWNILGSNDASFNNGNGFEDSIIIARHIAPAAVGSSKLGLDFVEATLGADFTNPAGSTNFVDTGFGLTLPAIGTWLILTDARGNVNAGSSAFGVLKLRNNTTGLDIVDSERLIILNPGSTGSMNTLPVNMRVVTTTVNNVIRVWLKNGGATYGVNLNADPNGRTRIMAMRIG